MTKVYLISLGCPRNLVDSEVLLGLLEQKGFIITESAEDADVAVVNTCGFIQDAKQESIDVILQLAELKRSGKINKLLVAGCLSQRYPEALMDEIKEVDALFGTADLTKIPGLIGTVLPGKRISEVTRVPEFLYDHLYERKLLTPPHYAYVKIQEGCSNRCSYCVIPDLKGPHRSRTIDSVLTEIKDLRSRHDVKELLLIGQDTTSFGIDRGEGPLLAKLLMKASPLMKSGWIRLLYTHPAHFTSELIDVLAATDNICKYVDLPVQHINDRILQKMNRRTTRSGITSLIDRIRKRIKDVTLRTSIIVGFPGETDDDFRELLDFLKDTGFERLGAFLYSREDGTPAANFTDQVPEELKKERFAEVMKLQQKISAEKNMRFLDKQLKTLIDESDPSDPERFVGRSQMDAPEVDGVIYVKGAGIRAGDFVDVHITGAMEYDLTGEAV